MNGIGADGAAKLATALPAGLKHLFICFNGLGDEGVLALDLPRLEELEELDLRCNGLTSDGLSEVAVRLDIKKFTKHMQHMRVSRSDGMTERRKDVLVDMLPFMRFPPTRVRDLDDYMFDLCNMGGSKNEDSFSDSDADATVSD